jgi:hypothetical protein
MSNTDNIDQETYEKARDEFAQNSENIREWVRNITLNALSKRKLNTDEVQGVVRAVLDGVAENSQGKPEIFKQAVNDAVLGVDDALGKGAEAAKLAIEEAIGHAKEFSNQDLKSSINELKSLEDLLFETLGLVAKQSNEVVANIFNDLASHLKSSGTVVGAEVQQATADLQEQLKTAGREGRETIEQTGRAIGEQIAQVASGILSGMADAINPREKK